MNAVRGVYKEMLVPALLLGCETLAWYDDNKARVRAV